MPPLVHKCTTERATEPPARFPRKPEGWRLGHAVTIPRAINKRCGQTPAAPSPAALGPPLSFGACGPLAVKTKPCRAENGGRVVAGAPARTTPVFRS